MGKAAPLTLVLFAGVAAALLWVELNQPIRTVHVAGELTIGEQNEIRAAMETSLGRGLHGIDLVSVRASIYRLSWPRKVMVRRSWPAGLVIQVEKDLAVAVWGKAGHLTSDGRVMQFPQAPVGLPEFICARSQPRAALQVYERLRETLAGSDVEISVLRESELGEWEIELDSGLRVILGRYGLVARMRRFVLAFERHLHDRIEMAHYVDARYANGIAVRWKTTLLAYEDETRYGI